MQKYIVLKCHIHLMIPPLQLGPFDMQDASINRRLSSIHICARTTIDQNAPAEERGRDRNLLRTEVIKSCGRNAQQFVPVRTCHRHSAIHPQVSCELDLPASLCKLPRCIRKVIPSCTRSLLNSMFFATHVKLLDTT